MYKLVRMLEAQFTCVLLILWLHLFPDLLLAVSEYYFCQQIVLSVFILAGTFSSSKLRGAS